MKIIHPGFFVDIKIGVGVAGLQPTPFSLD